MVSPIQSVKYIHKAIRTDTEMLEDETARLTAEDTAGAEHIARRLTFLYDVVKAHEDGEEAAIFPLLDERVCVVSAPYLLDHRVDQLHMQESVESFARLATMRDAAERGEALRRLSHQAIILNAAMVLHIRKEEELVLPSIEEHFTSDEQAEMVRGAVSHFPPPLLQVTLPWILKAHSLDEREAFLREMMVLVPPPVFQMMLTWAEAALPKPEWENLQRRLPKAA